jgi:CBS domain-containing protein/nucleotide-binding universal stress UspA family protein
MPTNIVMRIREWMTPSPITVTPTTPVAGLHEMMSLRRLRHLPVMDDGHLVGIITDRDLRTVLPSPATSFSVGEIRFLLERLTVGEVMTRRVLIVEPEAPLAEAVRQMLEQKIGALPVVEHGRLVGIITEIDVLRAFASVLGIPGVDVAGAARREAAPPTILVPLDGAAGSEAVLPAVGELARAEGARVRLLFVAQPPGEVRANDDRVIAYADQETARVEAEMLAYLRRVGERLYGVEVDLAVRFGEPADEIVKEAAATGPAMIAMASHRRSGLERIVKGSVAERVERATRVPVMLVQHGETSAT